MEDGDGGRKEEEEMMKIGWRGQWVDDVDGEGKAMDMNRRCWG